MMNFNLMIQISISSVAFCVIEPKLTSLSIGHNDALKANYSQLTTISIAKYIYTECIGQNNLSGYPISSF